MFFNLMKIYYESNQDGGNGNNANNDNSNNGDNNQSESENFATVEEWYKSLSEDQKKLADPVKTHFDRVYASVKSTRDERDTLSGQLRDAIKKTKEGSPEREQLEKISNDLEVANRRGDFYEEAPSHKCLSPKAAYALAVTLELFDKKGRVDWKDLEKEAPELFGEARKVLPRKGGAGAGANDLPAKSSNMNNWIREQAGKGSITQP